MKVAALISGGVDSSTALQLLAQNPEIELTAFYLKIWLEEELSFLGDCPWEEDIHYAQTICRKLGIALKIIPLQTEYRAIPYRCQSLRANLDKDPVILEGLASLAPEIDNNAVIGWDFHRNARLLVDVKAEHMRQTMILSPSIAASWQGETYQLPPPYHRVGE